METPATPSLTRLRLAVLLVFALAVSACGATATENFAEIDASLEDSSAESASDASFDGDAESSFEADTAEVFTDEEAMEDPAAMAEEEAMEVEGAPAESRAAEDSELIEAAPEELPVEPVQAVPGLLTAGDIDDNINFDFFTSILNDWSNNSQDLAQVNLDDRVIIDLVGENGVGVGNFALEITDGQTTRTVVTNSAGRAHLFPNWLGLAASDGLNVSSGNQNWEIGAGEVAEGVVQLTADATTTSPTAIDIAIVLDVTGSMSDELAYLTTEFEAIVARLDEQYSNVDKRFALVVYRDRGENFVTQTYDFTSSVEEMRNALASQSAGGGGDFPEAMDAALSEATELSWSEGSDVARVLVLNADAPPHSQYVQDSLDYATQLGESGVRIYSLAASGVDRGAEFIMRTMAVTTGGSHLFLTSDSGIGGAKLEPRAECYQVTGLDDLLYRVLATELAGERIDVDPGEVIRTVGQVDNGACV